jgi:nucleoid-associated protein YgaU
LKPKQGETQRNLSQSQNAPAPIAARNQNPEPGQDLWIPKHNQAWETTTPGKTVSSSSPSRNENTRTHRVTGGDTLTGLAARYLGSSARYKEIYEANRDVLQAPNDLRAGMVLRIPQTAPPGASRRTDQCPKRGYSTIAMRGATP